MYETVTYTDRRNFRIEDVYFNGIIRKKSGLDISGTKKVLCQHVPGENKAEAVLARFLKMRHDQPVKNLAMKLNIDLQAYL